MICGNLNARQYTHDILTPEAILYMARHGPGQIFQKDNATPHAARVTQNFLKANGINVLPWPAQSLGFNPIEHLWDELGRRVRRRDPQNLRQLERALMEEWWRIPVRAIRHLTGSMRR